METDYNEKTKTWLGSSMSDMCRSKGPWSFSISPVIPSKYHCVLYHLPVNLQNPPKPHLTSQPCHWDEDHVRMPYSKNNVFPVIENGISVLKLRWKLISNVLSKPINTSKELEIAIHSYNKNIPKFTALHSFFNEEENSLNFFTTVLPEVIKLALQLPEIMPQGLPLLKKNHCRSVSLSQLQIACLLANAFLCTIPWRKEMMFYPGINFSTLFAAHSDTSSQKLKCICHYFKRVTTNHPVGTVTFERKFLPRSSMPRWDGLDNNLGNTKLHICSSGTIEDDGLGLLQVDFANKNIGGGVLGYGCVQEEIRFVICPELILCRLFIEQLGDNEAVIVTGAERYSNYTGYADTFQWSGNYDDQTPHDEFGRRRTTISVIDATYFGRTKDQFYPSAILRELNKAYVGFSSREKDNLAPVATGNWGCGAFRGDPKLKSLIQLMACCAAGRDLVYYTFGDVELKGEFYNMHMFLANNRILIKQLWKFLGKFASSSAPQTELYSFIQQSFFDSKNQPTIRKFFTCNLKSPKESPSTSSTSLNESSREVSKEVLYSPTESNKSDPDDKMDCALVDDDIIPATPPEETVSKIGRFVFLKKEKAAKEDVAKKIPNNHDDIVRLLGMVDGNANKSVEDESFLSEIDKIRRNSSTNQSEVLRDVQDKMEVEDASEKVMENKSQKRKITDYFTKPSKS